MMRTFLPLCASFGLLACILTSAKCKGQPLSDVRSAFDIMAKTGGDCDYQAECLLPEAKFLLNSSDCASREAGAAIHLQFPTENALQIIESIEECDISFWPVHYIVGNWFYSQDKFSLALTQFVQAEHEKMEPIGSAYTNQGACYFALEEWNLAASCLEDAWAFVDTSNLDAKYMILNNLAALNLKFGEFEEALKWVDLAQINFQAIERTQPNLSEADLHLSRNIIEINRWFANIGLKNSSFVQANWRQLNWGALGIEPWAWLKLFVQAAELIQDQAFFDAQIRNFRGVALEVSQNPPVDLAELGNYRLLLTHVEKHPEDIMGLLKFWKALTMANVLNQTWTSISVAAQQEWDEIPQREEWRQWLYVGILIASFTSMLVLSRLTSRRNRNIKRSKDDLQKVLTQWQMKQSSKNEALDALDLLERFSPSNFDVFFSREGFDLNESEKTVLKSIEMSESPKELAQRKGWSPKYVYSLRSKLRKDLDIPTDESIEDWLRKSLKS